MTIQTGEYLGTQTTEHTHTDTITSAGFYTYQLKPPNGYVYVVRGMYGYVGTPAGSGSGTHYFYVRNDSSDSAGVNYQWLIRLTSDHTDALKGFMSSNICTTSQAPATDQEILDIFAGGLLKATYDEGVSVRYYNGTDVDNTNDITLLFIYDVYKEVLC